MTTALTAIYKGYFETDYENKLNNYKEWKKDRPAKHQETKALRKAKLEANQS